LTPRRPDQPWPGNDAAASLQHHAPGGERAPRDKIKENAPEFEKFFAGAIIGAKVEVACHMPATAATEIFMGQRNNSGRNATLDEHKRRAAGRQDVG
jgi:hypothetical protein